MEISGISVGVSVADGMSQVVMRTDCDRTHMGVPIIPQQGPFAAAANPCNVL